MTNGKTTYAWLMLTLFGVVLSGMGLYFIFLRPALLPEDPRYIGAPLAEIRAAAPGLENWLQKVFWVMGGYIAATGALFVHLAATAFRRRERGAVGVALLAGAISIGLMAAVNFIIASDFRWLLFSFAVLWLLSLMSYSVKR